MGFELSFDRLDSALLGEAIDDPTVDTLVKLLLKHIEDQLDLCFSDLDFLLCVLELFELLTSRLIGRELVLKNLERLYCVGFRRESELLFKLLHLVQVALLPGLVPPVFRLVGLPVFVRLTRPVALPTLGTGSRFNRFCLQIFVLDSGPFLHLLLVTSR